MTVQVILHFCLWEASIEERQHRIPGVLGSDLKTMLSAAGMNSFLGCKPLMMEIFKKKYSVLTWNSTTFFSYEKKFTKEKNKLI
jgi:hypothetical protein